jgi:hypothetical protein
MALNMSEDGECIVHIIVIFLSFASLFRSFIILKEVVLSSPLVGSSHNRKFGSVINSYPILVLLRSPPEIPFIRIPPILVFLQFLRPNLSTISSIFSSILEALRLVLSFAANLKDSSGVNVSRSTSSYYTNAPNLPKSFFCSFLLLHLTSPATLDPLLRPSLYPRMFKKEVFPLPLAPITAMTWPGLANPFNL